MTIDLDTQSSFKAKIGVIGVGGAGGNAVDNMIKRGVEGVAFFTANTDKQALDKTLAEEKILLGANTTKGLGAGAKPEVGKKATEETSDIIKNLIEGFDLIFITCGMGGGTGTGGAPVIAKIAKETGALVVGIVSKCFSREGSNKMQLAETGIAALKENVDAIIVVPNDKILEVCRGIRPIEAYSKANDILYNAVRGIVELIVKDAFMNVDFADVKTTLTDIGEVIIGIGAGKGENAAREAVENALNSPFFDGLAIQSTNRILFNIQAGKYSTEQIDEAYKALREAAGEDVHLVTGEDYDDNSDEFVVTIIAPASKSNETKKNKVLKNDKTNEVIENKPKTYDNSTVMPRQTKIKKNIYENKEEVIDLFNTEINVVNDVAKPSDLIAGHSKIHNVAAARKETVESIETTPTPLHRFGRPHGDEELKNYDIPAYIRRGKTESKYNIINNDNINEIVTDTVPEEVDREKIQRFVNQTNERQHSNNFVRFISDKGLSSK